MKKSIFALIIFALIGALWFLSDADWSQKSDQPETEGTEALPAKSESIAYRIEAVATGLNTPWSIVFPSPSRMLVVERPGRLRVVENGTLVKKPLHVFSEVSVGGEEGLMSLALDPRYAENKFLYVSLAYKAGKDMFVKVVRFRDEWNTLADKVTVIDRIPAAQYHAGCRIAFGPDGKLYMTTGDATDKRLPQDIQSLGGKILRVNSDGSIPSDNPFPGSPVWSYGHRNPQGIAWHPATKEMYSSEHGPSGFDGPGGGDEVNRIVQGGNYGWPLVSHEKRKEGTVAPMIVFTPAEAPASLLIYSGAMFPQWKHHLFFGALRGKGLMRMALDEKNPDRIVSHEKLGDVRFGRIREVMEGPDGSIYFSTSNRDGRGTPAASDDRIFRILAKNH